MKLQFDPDFTVVVVLAGNRVISKKEAAAHYPSLKFQFLGQSLHFSRKLSNLFLKLLAAATKTVFRQEASPLFFSRLHAVTRLFALAPL